MEPYIKDESFGIAPWENMSPCKSPRCAERNFRKKSQEVYKVTSLPYRPRTIQSKFTETTRKKSIMHNILLEVPVKSAGFPKRIIKSPNRLVYKSFLRSSSCTNDSISVFDIENIERTQRLLPYRPLIINKYSAKKPKKNSHSLSSPNESLLSLGIIKEAACTHANYRKYIKEKNL